MGVAGEENLQRRLGGGDERSKERKKEGGLNRLI